LTSSDRAAHAAGFGYDDGVAECGNQAVPPLVSPHTPRPPERARTVSDGQQQRTCSIRFRGEPARWEVPIDRDGELELTQHLTTESGAMRFAEQQRETCIGSGWQATDEDVSTGRP
jgi:hypothetical protein